MSNVIDFTKYRKKIENDSDLEIVESEVNIKEKHYRFQEDKTWFWEEVKTRNKHKYIIENNRYYDDYIEFVGDNKRFLEDMDYVRVDPYETWVNNIQLERYADELNEDDDFLEDENEDEEDLSDYPI